jgi:uncharacterized protein (DUF1800 family)
MPAPSSSTVLSRADAVRFLQRTTFGPRPRDVDELIDIGVDAWFALQTSMTPEQTHLDRVQPGSQLSSSIWRAFLGGRNQLRHRYAYALSQIFVVSSKDLFEDQVANFADILEAKCFGTFRDLLEQVTRSHAMGRYLTYDRNRRAAPNSTRVPDENYAREVVQLFTVGLWKLERNGTRSLDSSGEPIPAYTQDDIVGLARVFTGFSSEAPTGDRFDARRPMNSTGTFAQENHEHGEKRFLGTTIAATPNRTLDESLAIALDALANHSNTAPFISHQLIQRLVTSNPSPDYVERVAQVFADDGHGTRGNLQAVLHAVVFDDEAWQAAPPTSFGKVREPVLRFTAIARALSVSTTISNGNWHIGKVDQSTQLGQHPYESPSVFNFYRPGYVPPQSALGEAGLLAPEMQLADETTTIGWINTVTDLVRSGPSKWGLDYAFDELIAMVNVKNVTDAQAAKLVDELVSRLCPSGLTGAARAIVIRNLKAITDPQYDPNSNNYRVQQLTQALNLDRVVAAVTMIAASTDFLYER